MAQWVDSIESFRTLLDDAVTDREIVRSPYTFFLIPMRKTYVRVSLSKSSVFLLSSVFWIKSFNLSNQTQNPNLWNYLHQWSSTGEGVFEFSKNWIMESLTEATSGAIGALLSTTILYPLDTCKTRYQAEGGGSHAKPKYRYHNQPPLSFFPLYNFKFWKWFDLYLFFWVFFILSICSNLYHDLLTDNTGVYKLK